MEKQIDFVLKLSLKEMALRKLVVCLWNEKDILVFIEKSIGRYLESWQETVEVQVKNKVSKLAIPKSLKEQMMFLVGPIGLDIVTWKRFHENYIRYQYFDVHILKQLQWSCIGAIDDRKTAEKLVCLEMFDIVKRYRLACFYCLVDYIPLLWKELDEESQMRFYHFDPKDISEIKLENVWPYILKGEQSVLDEITRRNLSKSFNECIMGSVACFGNKAAIKHFFPLLTAEEQDCFLVTAIYDMVDCSTPWLLIVDDFSRRRYGDGLCYLLSMMRPEEQMQVLRKKPYQILSCLHDWQWYDLFVDLTNILWTFLPEIRNFFLLKIVTKIVRINSYFFPNLLLKVFLSGPSKLKRDFGLIESHGFNFFRDFFRNQDTESIKLVLRNLDATDRVDFVSSLTFFIECNYLIGKDKWHLVELCFREAIQSKEDKERLKKRFMLAFKMGDTIGHLLKRRLIKREWEEIIELLEVADTTSDNKRRLEDAAVKKAKRTFH